MFTHLRFLLIPPKTQFIPIWPVVTNGCCGKDYRYLFFPRGTAKVHVTATIESEFNTIVSRGITEARKQELRKALDMAVAARKIFDHSKPHFPKEHIHYYVANASDILNQLEKESAKKKFDKKMQLTASQTRALKKSLNDAGDAEVSFSVFVRLLAKALSGSLESVRMSKWLSQRKNFDLYTSVYDLPADIETIEEEH